MPSHYGVSPITGRQTDYGGWKRHLGRVARGEVASEGLDRIGAALRALGQRNPEGLNQFLGEFLPVGGALGHIAYHGSPHKFSKFDISKIGTGEGAQAYGHGLYFAEDPKVAETYRRMAEHFTPLFERRAGDHRNTQAIINMIGEAVAGGAKKEDALSDIVRLGVPGAEGFPLERLSFATGGRGHLYKADIPDEWIPKMLDWDRPVGEQAGNIHDAFRGNILSLGRINIPAMTGGTAYRGMTRSLSPEKARDVMLRHDIPGIMYLDQMSRDAFDMPATRNLVTFGDEGIRILERQ